MTLPNKKPIMSHEANRDEPNLFLNRYRCYRCGEDWTDVYECQPDDDCPHCGARHVSPFASEDFDKSESTD